MMSIEDDYASEDIDSVATVNYQGFLKMKHALVARRRMTRTLEEMAAFTGDSVDEIRAFEAYDSDPTVSQIERYAVAVMSRIEISCEPHETPSPQVVFGEWSMPSQVGEVVQPGVSIENIGISNAQRATEEIDV